MHGVPCPCGRGHKEVRQREVGGKGHTSPSWFLGDWHILTIHGTAHPHHTIKQEGVVMIDMSPETIAPVSKRMRKRSADTATDVRLLPPFLLLAPSFSFLSSSWFGRLSFMPCTLRPIRQLLTMNHHEYAGRTQRIYHHEIVETYSKPHRQTTGHDCR
jgi:hypothetical protein